ncbi:MAG: acyltransferase [Verrucomicrobia bacterium]|nr:acyltransferase [Verrucomicrobiota bacterium]
MRLLLLLLCLSLGISCLTHAWSPTLEFYHLATRAWELLAGCSLAVFLTTRTLQASEQGKKAMVWGGLFLLGAVLCWGSSEGHPGWSALAVVGTVLVLAGVWDGSAPCAVLNQPAVRFVGKISFSLYLVYWPVFTLVDYRWFLQSDLQRLLVKVPCAFAVAILSYRLLEVPSRAWLRAPHRQWAAFLFALVTVTVGAAVGCGLTPLLVVDPSRAQIRAGGVVFPAPNEAGRVLLCGDSYAAMYTMPLRQRCQQLGLRLTVLTQTGSNPLPGGTEGLWEDIERVVRHEAPDVIVLASNWDLRLRRQEARLSQALSSLKAHARMIVLVAAPPLPPLHGNRAGIRAGASAPFFEDVQQRSRRERWDRFLERNPIPKSGP